MTTTSDALPLPVLQMANTSVSLNDLLTSVYGDQVGSIAGVNIEFRDATYLQTPRAWRWGRPAPVRERRSQFGSLVPSRIQANLRRALLAASRSGALTAGN